MALSPGIAGVAVFGLYNIVGVSPFGLSARAQNTTGMTNHKNNIVGWISTIPFHVEGTGGYCGFFMIQFSFFPHALQHTIKWIQASREQSTYTKSKSFFSLRCRIFIYLAGAVSRRGGEGDKKRGCGTQRGGGRWVVHKVLQRAQRHLFQNAVLLVLACPVALYTQTTPTTRVCVCVSASLLCRCCLHFKLKVMNTNLPAIKRNKMPNCVRCVCGSNASTSQTFYDQFRRWNLFASPKVYKYLFVLKKKQKKRKKKQRNHLISFRSQCGQVYYANCVASRFMSNLPIF